MQCFLTDLSNSHYCYLIIQHVVQGRDFTLGVSNDGELEIDIVDFVDVSNPLLVGLQLVGRETNNLDVASIKVFLESSNETKLGGADRGCLNIIKITGQSTFLHFFRATRDTY